jgi:hypothetical protein
VYVGESGVSYVIGGSDLRGREAMHGSEGE